MGRERKMFMQKAVKHPGALRRALHAKKGENIPEAAIQKAAHSNNLHLRKMGQLAETFKKHRL